MIRPRVGGAPGALRRGARALAAERPTGQRGRTAASVPEAPILAARRMGTLPAPRLRIVYSGIQPTGDLHIGNYFGAVQQWLKVQQQATRAADGRGQPAVLPDSAEPVVPIFSIADLHALTTTPEPGVLDKSVHDLAAMLVACGIDPGISMLSRQSLVRCVPPWRPGASERQVRWWLCLGRAPTGARVGPQLLHARRPADAHDPVEGTLARATARPRPEWCHHPSSGCTAA
jgi:hypothetical protein